MPGRSNNIWWGAPRKFAGRQEHRKIGWLELFYDLVYVAVVGQITHQIAEHPTWANAGFAFLLFCLIFWSWVNGSQYYDLHGTDAIRTRLTTFWQMLAVAGVAITIHDAFEGHTTGFAIAFSMIQILIVFLWWSVGWYDPSHRVFSKFYTINHLISFALILIAIFAGYTSSIALWLIVLILNVTPPLTGASTFRKVLKQRGEVFTASEALVERFGLFTIIVLAETILATVNAVAEVKDKAPAVWIAFALSILIAYLLWSLYFDMTSEQQTKTGYGYMQWLIFLHFPILGSYCITGACIKVILTEIDVAASATVQWMLCASLATTLMMIAGLTRIMKEMEEDRSYIRPMTPLLVIISIALMLIPLFGLYFNNLMFLGIITILLFIPVFVGIKSWAKYRSMHAED